MTGLTQLIIECMCGVVTLTRVHSVTVRPTYKSALSRLSKRVLTFQAFKMTNFSGQQVLKPLSSYKRAFTVIKIFSQKQGRFYVHV